MTTKQETTGTEIASKAAKTMPDPKEAAQLYIQGKPVVEVAKDLEITYGQARRLIASAGVSMRDPSARLKGRTHLDLAK